MGMCERCKKAQATFHLTNIDPSGEKVERHLCERCAVDEGHVQLQKPAFVTEVIDNFVAGAKKDATGAGNIVCDECGISYLEFRNHGLLGCPDDYDAFKDHLAPLIERAHDGATHHVGKSPASLNQPRTSQQDIARIRRQLDDAVIAEDYERAAELRDRIRELEEK